ncbi:uncharacterized protein CDV56_107592 [Aspergillus thermomutatus]|uniref:Uncharacterized protein n=1 Tax=Aspergillus thermomutatus TaxID=41047 RepID=A0A397HA82_ASPTH|nr:uncharacterized protein CDV56_107592 [Aspergillus thermomutatus]RHZ57310.1 hypothetical protein CDV56_107592 [Aspergillus thermomutatus]
MTKDLFRHTSYVSRLQNLQKLDSSSKRTLLCSIATDITATFICISKHIENGTLSDEHTGSIEGVIDIIKGTEVSQRRMLERKVKRYARLARRLKIEREWMRREFGKLVKRADAVNGRWRERVRNLEVVNKAMMRELVVKGRQNEMLKMGMDKGDERQAGRETAKATEDEMCVSECECEYPW